MKALFYIAVAVIVSYLAYTIYAFNKIPKSISDTYYQWEERNAKYLFTAVMWLVTIFLLPYWVAVSPDSVQFLPFLSMSGLAFVGGAAAMHETLTRGVHFTSAGIWATSAILFMVLTDDWLSIGVGLLFGAVTLLADRNRRKHYFFWLECACITAMMVCIYSLR